jgi:hypothetical protein
LSWASLAVSSSTSHLAEEPPSAFAVTRESHRERAIGIEWSAARTIRDSPRANDATDLSPVPSGADFKVIIIAEVDVEVIVLKVLITKASSDGAVGVNDDALHDRVDPSPKVGFYGEVGQDAEPEQRQKSPGGGHLEREK